MPILLANFTTHTANNIINSRSSGEPTDQRSLWDILWSCVVTIFACTWIAIHPNIPAADDVQVMITFRRIGLMLCGMIAPEIIILWAMRQWYSARRIGKVHKDKGWTTTHGFFIQMGGFMMHDGRNSPYPIQLGELEARREKGKIIWPRITETEIQDRSKGDALSKGIVILQTSWFLVQCIGRRCVGLAITELELITLAFAALNIATYFFWWNKPVDVRCPHPIYLKKNAGKDVPAIVPDPKSLLTLFGHLVMDLIHFLWACIKLFVPPIKAILHDKGVRLLLILNFIQRPPSLLLKFLLRGALAIKGNPSRITAGRVPTLYAARLDSNPTVFFLMTIACALIGSIFGGIHCIAWSFQFISHRDQLMWQVSSLVITCAPLFIALLSNNMSHAEDVIFVQWVGLPEPPPLEFQIMDHFHADPQDPRSNHNQDVDRIQYSDGSIHGVGAEDVVHKFPRYIALLQWLSSVKAIMQGTARFQYTDRLTSWRYALMTFIWVTKCLLLAGLSSAYIAARFILILQALRALKTLPPDALQTMKWTNYIPHI